MKFFSNLLTVFLVIGPIGAAVAEPYTPSNPDEVIEVLPASFRAGADLRKSIELRQSLDAKGQNPSKAVLFARQQIALGRKSGEQRFFGYAEAALRPWYDASPIPTEVRVLRAYLRQHSHDFRGALDDLTVALAADPRSAQAWITKASIHYTLGEIREGIAACQALSQLSPSVVATVCELEGRSKSGDAERALAEVQTLLAAPTGLSDSEYIWGITLVWDIADRLSKSETGEASFRQAFARASGDLYTLNSLADVLIEQGRFAEVVELLRGHEENEGAAARIGVAGQATGDVWAVDVGKRTLAQLRSESTLGNKAHQREEAILSLAFDPTSEATLIAARENWRVQRESIDNRVFARAAQIQNAIADIAELKAWMKSTGYEDSVLTNYLAGVSKPR